MTTFQPEPAVFCSRCILALDDDSWPRPGARLADRAGHAMYRVDDGTPGEQIPACAAIQRARRGRRGE